MSDYLSTTDEQSTLDRVHLSEHALNRMFGRRIPFQSINIAVKFGRKCYSRGALILIVGHKEVQREMKNGVDLRDYEGLVFIINPKTKEIITAFRNNSFKAFRDKSRGCRPPKYRRSFC